MDRCSFKECGETLDLSEVVITFKDSVNAPEDHRVEAVVQDLLVCPNHANPQPAAFVTDDGWNKIVAGMLGAGLAAPARDTVKIVFRPTQRALDGDPCECNPQGPAQKRMGINICVLCGRPRQ